MIKYKKKKPTGELKLFQEIWSNTKYRHCENCDVKIESFSPVNFSHIVPKGKRNDLRLDPNNIELLCFPCHYKYEFGTLDEIRSMKHSDKKKEYLKENNYMRYAKIWGDD